jgi:two-component sensor histidine kinase
LKKNRIFVVQQMLGLQAAEVEETTFCKRKTSCSQLLADRRRRVDALDLIEILISGRSKFYFCPGTVVIVSASRTEDPGFKSRLCVRF